MPVIWVRISMCRLISGSLYFVGKEQSMRTKKQKTHGDDNECEFYDLWRWKREGGENAVNATTRKNVRPEGV